MQLTAELNSEKLKVAKLKEEFESQVPRKNQLAEAAEETDNSAIEDAAVQQAAEPAEAAGENPFFLLLQIIYCTCYFQTVLHCT